MTSPVNIDKTKLLGGALDNRKLTGEKPPATETSPATAKIAVDPSKLLGVSQTNQKLTGGKPVGVKPD